MAIFRFAVGIVSVIAETQREGSEILINCIQDPSYLLDFDH